MRASSATIYLIEDDLAARTAVGRLLRSAHYRTRLYASGEEFLGDASAGRPPGCVILDLVMPGGMGGIELLERLKAPPCRCPIIVLSAYATPERAFRAGKLGAFEFIRKPFDEAVLFSKIEAALASVESAMTPRSARRAAAQQLVVSLSARERQVLACLKRNRRRKSVAEEIGVAVSTVKWHCDNIFRKLGVHNLPDALEIWDAVMDDSG